MVVVDSNVLLRFFLEDNIDQFQKAKKLLMGEKDLFIPESVCAEVGFVLEKVYKFPRARIVDVYRVLLSAISIRVPSEIPFAVTLYEESSIAIVDCIAAAHAQGNKLATFDKKLLHQSKTTPYWK